MALKPTLDGEDPDEDFFDKLVDDECQRSDFNEIGDLSINDTGGGEDVLDSKSGEVNGDVERLSSIESSSLILSGSCALSSAVESNNPVMEPKVSESTVDNSYNSEGSGVREVQWSLFNSKSAQDEGHGSGSYSDFFNDLGDSAEIFLGNIQEKQIGKVKKVPVNEDYKNENFVNSVNPIGRDFNSSQDWENLYPGWIFDHTSGQWYQVNDFDTVAINRGAFDSNTPVVSNGKQVASCLQQTGQSAPQTITDCGTTTSISNWNQGSLMNNGYPEHMIFDPQYPGWYYDTNAQEWRPLHPYAATDQTTFQTNGLCSTSTSYQNIGSVVNNNYGHAGNYRLQPQGHGNQGQNSSWSATFNNQPVQSHVPNYGSQDYGCQGVDGIWNGSPCTYNPPNPNGYASTAIYSHATENKVYAQCGKSNNYDSQGHGCYVQDSKCGESFSNNSRQHGSSVWQLDSASWSASNSFLRGNQQKEDIYGSKTSLNNSVRQVESFNSSEVVQMCSEGYQGHVETTRTGFQSSVPCGNFCQQFNQENIEQNEATDLLDKQYSGHKILDYSAQSALGGHQPYYSPSKGRSSTGRPSHALVTFGFGGKLIVMKDTNSSSNSSYGNQEPFSGPVSLLNLIEVVTEKPSTRSITVGASNYFLSLCQQSFPCPLVGGSVGSKELNKWIDKRLANFECEKSEDLRLLLSLLKIACQYYGKFRSPCGPDTLRDNDAPETAVAKLFASAKRNGAQVNQYGALAHCLRKFPSENQLHVTASDVQNLLVSGRKKEALLCAQEGQLWGPALVLASQLGDQFYVDTVKQMALQELVPGSPLRTLCLLIAGQPADVFSTDLPTVNGFPSDLSMSPQPAQFGANGILDDWENNLAVITANRTKDDQLVLLHLGDCLWKERSEITAAHICYLVAEANIESYSDSARLCLIGADHWRYPRSFASPEAIQRTELYEYAKVLGNSQFSLIPFQPYKLMYAYMLAEVGKVSDSLKYCQTVVKSLKNSRAPEVDMWKQLASNLDERIRTHQQGGYASNLAPKKLVGKLLNFFDSTTHRVVGGLPPMPPSTLPGRAQGKENNQQAGNGVSTSQSTMAMSTLVSSATKDTKSERKNDSNRRIMHNRSASEPSFGINPSEVDFTKDEASPNAQGKTSNLSGSSRFGRFGFGSQLFQKTVGLVLKPRADRQAKLGETNKFYYNEKLKRWVEEGSEPPADEASLPPPPLTAAFQNAKTSSRVSSSDSKSTTSSESSSGIPPIPSGSSHFSACGRTGVRSRYVDTFNKGGASATNLFKTASAQSMTPGVSSDAKFFIPSPVSSCAQIVDPTTENVQETCISTKDPSTSSRNGSFQSPSLSSSTSTSNFQTDGAFSSRSHQTASWGGFNEIFSPPKVGDVKPLGEVLGLSPSTFLPDDPSFTRSLINGASFSDDLHEVDL